jgi:hypothetical protein
LPDLIEKAKCSPHRSKLEGGGPCTFIKAARLTGSDTAKIDLIDGHYSATEKKETAYHHCSLYLTWHRNAWSVVRFDGSRGVEEKDGAYRDKVMALIFAIDEFAGANPGARK